MGEKKTVKKSAPRTEAPEVEKVVSPKRVAIASVICILITGVLIWTLSQAAQRLVEFTMTPAETQRVATKTDVRLPQKGDASNIMNEAKKSLSEFSLDKYTASGSAARSVIDTLQDLQRSEFGIEDYFCQIFCQ